MDTVEDAMIANRHTRSTSTSSAGIAGHEGVDHDTTGSSTCCYDGEVHVQCPTTSAVAQAQVYRHSYHFMGDANVEFSNMFPEFRRR